MEERIPQYNSRNYDSYYEARARLASQSPPRLNPPGANINQPVVARQDQRLHQSGGKAQPKPAARMPKERALALAHACKRWLIVSSVGAFALFSGLAAYHQASATTAKSTASTTTQTKSSVTVQVTPTATSSKSSKSSSLKQKKGNNLGTTTTTPTATATATATATPVSSSSVS